jgi:hypothetical protein
MRSQESDKPCHPAQFLFLDYAAGDAVASVACRIGLHVIRLGMDHQRSSAVAEQRVAVAASSQVHIGITDPDPRFAVLVHREVHHVPGVMAVRILKAVLFAIWIEVWPRRLEVWRIATGILMNVDRVFAWRKIMHAELDLNPTALRRLDGGRAYAFALRILQIDFDRSGRSRQGQSDDQ